VIRRIHADDIRAWATKVGFDLNDQEVAEFLVLTSRMLEKLDGIETITVPAHPVSPARREPLGRPGKHDDPLNAVIQRCKVTSSDEGLLSGKRVGLKDSMAVAGIPMTGGSRLLSDYVPQMDCVVAERVLAAGGEIVAKLNMDDFAFSAGGETSHFGPVKNPYDLTRTASGSSSGPAAALSYDWVDITFGTDQGGSVRLPAAWCGVLGMKGTFGLIPYTGIASIDAAYDHVGPMARTVEDLALAMEAVAGFHDSDPRQRREAPGQDFLGAIRQAADDFTGVTVGVLEEGFAVNDGPSPEGTQETMDATREVVDKLSAMGATVKEISIPEHTISVTVKLAALAEGYAATFHGFGNSYHQLGPYWEDFGVALGKGMKAHSDDLHPTVKSGLIVGNFLRERYFGSFYSRARNWAPVLRAAYDRALSDTDVIVMPTATHYAHRAAPEAPLAETVWRSWTCNGNTGAANVSGHPAISLPAAMANDLPVGVMLVGKTFGDSELLACARTYERVHGWSAPT